MPTTHSLCSLHFALLIQVYYITHALSPEVGTFRRFLLQLLLDLVSLLRALPENFVLIRIFMNLECLQH